MTHHIPPSTVVVCHARGERDFRRRAIIMPDGTRLGDWYEEGMMSEGFRCDEDAFCLRSLPTEIKGTLIECLDQIHAALQAEPNQD